MVYLLASTLFSNVTTTCKSDERMSYEFMAWCKVFLFMSLSYSLWNVSDGYLPNIFISYRENMNEDEVTKNKEADKIAAVFGARTATPR